MLDIREMLRNATDLKRQQIKLLNIPDVMSECNFHIQAQCVDAGKLLQAAAIFKPKHVWVSANSQSPRGWINIFCSWNPLVKDLEAFGINIFDKSFHILTITVKLDIRDEQDSLRMFKFIELCEDIDISEEASQKMLDVCRDQTIAS